MRAVIGQLADRTLADRCDFELFFLCKKISLIRRVGYIMDGSMDE